MARAKRGVQWEGGQEGSDLISQSLFLQTISPEALQLAAAAVFTGLTGAVAILYRDQRASDRVHREDLKKALHVMAEQTKLVSEMKDVVQTQTGAVTLLADEVSRCPHLVIPE